MLCLDVEKGRGSRVKRRESNLIKKEREGFGGFFFFFFFFVEVWRDFNYL